jgi:glycogen operon protein
LLAGDEFGRTQKGNNNAYCQDNEISWVDWKRTPRRQALLAFTRQVIKLRLAQPVLQRRSFFRGESLDDSRFRDLVWFHPEGHELGHEDWRNPTLQCFGMFLGGDAITARDPTGHRLIGDTLLVYLNASKVTVPVVLPPASWGQGWEELFSTTGEGQVPQQTGAGQTLRVPEQSVLVLRLQQPETTA